MGKADALLMKWTPVVVAVAAAVGLYFNANWQTLALFAVGVFAIAKGCNWRPATLTAAFVAVGLNIITINPQTPITPEESAARERANWLED